MLTVGAQWQKAGRAVRAEDGRSLPGCCRHTGICGPDYTPDPPRTRRSAPIDKPAGRAPVLNRDDIATVAGRTPSAGYGERGAWPRGRTADTSAYELPAGQVSFP
ncbi:MAG TPA: hypothetical protein VGF67_04550 [Ktedonobacteraceae bacterium]|jgi:hypothetical protein